MYQYTTRRVFVTGRLLVGSHVADELPRLTLLASEAKQQIAVIASPALRIQSEGLVAVFENPSSVLLLF